jgi:mannose-6-phosphate isomerase-like protein (cupin superfamily)
MTTETHFGGNIVRHPGATLPAMTLSDDPYLYRALALDADDELTFDNPRAWTLIIIDGGAALRCSTGDHVATCGMDEVLNGNGPGLTVRASAPMTVLLAGVTDAGFAATPRLDVMPRSACTFVEKPWGNETWLNGRHPAFAFKRIVIHAGHRTSLQYHEFKRETNLLLSGRARLHYKLTDCELRDVRDRDVATTELTSIAVVDVWPFTLHRIEAVSAITLYEVSTPHLDDVIRVSDDTHRADGLIADEHRRNAVHQPAGSTAS